MKHPCYPLNNWYFISKLNSLSWKHFLKDYDFWYLVSLNAAVLSNMAPTLGFIFAILPIVICKYNAYIHFIIQITMNGNLTMFWKFETSDITYNTFIIGDLGDCTRSDPVLGFNALSHNSLISWNILGYSLIFGWKISYSQDASNYFHFNPWLLAVCLFFLPKFNQDQFNNLRYLNVWITTVSYAWS